MAIRLADGFAEAREVSCVARNNLGNDLAKALKGDVGNHTLARRIRIQAG